MGAAAYSGGTIDDGLEQGARRATRGRRIEWPTRACPILWRGPSNVDRSVAPMAGVAADGRFLPAAQALGVRFFFRGALFAAAQRAAV